MFIFHISHTHYVVNSSIEILQFIDNGLIRHEICPNLFVNVTRWRRMMGRSEILLNNHLNSNEIFFNSIEGFTFLFYTNRNYHYNIFKATSEICSFFSSHMNASKYYSQWFWDHVNTLMIFIFTSKSLYDTLTNWDLSILKLQRIWKLHILVISIYTYVLVFLMILQSTQNCVSFRIFNLVEHFWNVQKEFCSSINLYIKLHTFMMNIITFDGCWREWNLSNIIERCQSFLTCDPSFLMLLFFMQVSNSLTNFHHFKNFCKFWLRSNFCNLQSALHSIQITQLLNFQNYIVNLC